MELQPPFGFCVGFVLGDVSVIYLPFVVPTHFSFINCKCKNYLFVISTLICMFGWMNKVGYSCFVRLCLLLCSLKQISGLLLVRNTKQIRFVAKQIESRSPEYFRYQDD